MEIKNVSIDSIRPYENNPRINDAAVEKVAESLKEFGWQQPIVVDRDGVIIAGHTRFKAAKMLGMQTVPVRVADLTEEQAKAYRLADNKTGEFADWDFEKLGGELDDLADFDMERFGFFEFDDDEEQGIDGAGGQERPEVEFTEELLLTHNYIVLYFDNEFDWEVAQDKFQIKQVKDLIPRKSQPVGVGRVINGKEVLKWLS